MSENEKDLDESSIESDNLQEEKEIPEGVYKPKILSTKKYVKVPKSITILSDKVEKQRIMINILVFITALVTAISIILSISLINNTRSIKKQSDILNTEQMWLENLQNRVEYTENNCDVLMEYVVTDKHNKEDK